jgi:hypothetical protein
LTADILKERFIDKKISDLIEFEDFMEADYFIFIHTLCHESDLSNPREIWYPFSSIYLDKPPAYIIKAENKRFLDILAKSCSCENPDEFIKRLKISSDLIHRMWPHGFYFGPLTYYNIEKLGTWP